MGRVYKNNIKKPVFINNSQNPKPQIPAHATLSFYKKGRKGSSEI